MVKQCRELFCRSARKSLPADRPRKDLKDPLIPSNIAGAVGIASLSWPCMYLGFLAMYRGMKSIKPYNSKILFPAHLLKCTCWCQSRVRPRADSKIDVESWQKAPSPWDDRGAFYSVFGARQLSAAERDTTLLGEPREIRQPHHHRERRGQ